MASGGAEEDDGGIPLDIDNVHMLLQVEHEQIQKRTFTNWINAQLAKRCPPSYVSDLFTDLREGSQLLDLLEVMSSQPMKRQRGRGVFQQRANIETALNFLKKKSIKLVNINIPDIIDGRPSIILGLIWTVILHCHIEELASTLSYSSCHSSLDSLASLDSWSGGPVPSSPAPLGRTSPLHRRFRLSAKKALLMWVRDQCQKVGCSISVKNFKSSWRSGEAFLAIVCSLRPQLVDLSLVKLRSNPENLEEAFHLAERELHIPRLLELEDVDVKEPDEKSIMTYVAQFLQYSNDMPAPDDHLQVSSTERALQVTSWLQRAYQELSEARAAAENSSFAEKYHVLQSLVVSFTEQRRPVMTLLAAIRRCPELSREQRALRTAWDCLENELQRCKVDLDSSLPPPLDSVVVWLRRAEASLTGEGGRSKDHADAAKEARARQDAQKTLMNEMSYFVHIIATFQHTDDLGNIVVPIEKFNEIKRSLTNIRVTAKYEGIKWEYQETRHTVLDLLGRVNAKVVTWNAPYRSQEAVLLLLQDWHETVKRHGLLLILMDALQNLKEKANTYTSKAALGEDAHLVARQLKESEGEAELVTRAVTAARAAMERAARVWETYNKCLASLETRLARNTLPRALPPPVGPQELSEWTSCQAGLNEAGNALIEVTESSAGLAVAERLGKVNRKWAEHVKRTKFAVPSEPSSGPWSLQIVHSLTQEASRLLRMPLEVSSVSLKANRQKLQLLSKKLTEVDISSQTSDTENLQQHLPKMLDDAERPCGELQRVASGLEGRLAELDHWSTEAMDCFQQPREKRHRGRSAWESAAKVLISRGVQLEKQVVTEGQDLQDLVARVQTTSPLLHLSTSGTQDRISEAVSHCQEILDMFGSLGFLQHVKSSHQTRRQPEAGLFVVAKTKQVDQIGNVLLAQDPNLVSPELSSQTSRQRALHRWATNQNGSATVNPCVETQMLPGPSREPILHIHSPLTQTIKEAEPEHMIQPRTLSERHAQASGWSHYDQVLPALIQTPFAQSVKTSPKPPVLVRSEVHSKAQSMARSRLEKARFRLQGRIQQAIKLFGGREVSESQVKKKQRAIKILQPVFMDEFLGAVEGLGAFSTGPQLQDLKVLSDSVRKQWEDVGREMAAFVPILWSKIREGKRSSSVVQCETQTNALHEAREQTDHDSLPQQQAVTERAASVEVESLEELCATLTPGQSSCLATDQLKESDEDQETPPSDTVLPSDRGGGQLGGAPPPRTTGESADTQQSSSLPQKQSVDRSQRRRVSPPPAAASASARPRGEVTHLQSQDEPTLPKTAEPSLLDTERLLKARLWQDQAHIQVVVRGNTVETKQEAEWTVLPGSAAHAQEERTSEQEVLGRVTSLEITADLMTLVTEKLDWLIRESVDISSFTFADPRLLSDLKEMDDSLRSEMRKLSERASEEEILSPPSRCQASHNSVHHLELLRQRLEEVQTAAQALDHFLVTVRDVKAETQAMLAKQDPSRQANEAEWQAARHQKLLTAAKQSDSVDSTLEAAGMTLTADGARVTCRDVVTSLSRQAVSVEEEVVRANERERKDDLRTVGREQGLVAKSSRPERDDGVNSQRPEEHEAQTQKSEEDALKAEEHKTRSIQVKKEREETLSGTLKEIREAAEQLRLQEPTLPALQHRTRALTELDSRLAELQRAQDAASQSGIQHASPTREGQGVWEEATKAVTERLEQCEALTELLKRFQSLHGELSGTLQRAESTVRERASYMGKDNLQRLHTKVQETKAELIGLGDGIEEVRSVCRQLHTRLRQIPECLSIPFEDETEAVMDWWLDVSEKTDSYLENLHLGLTLWDGIIELGAAVESWTSNKLAVVAQCPSFQTEEDNRVLQSEILTQEENMEHFHRRVAEIQDLLQSKEPPLELQVVETQIRKKMKQLKKLVSESEDVYGQEAAKGQITAGMAECFNSLRKIQNSLLTLSASDVPTVLAKLKVLLFELQTRDEQAERLLQDLHVMASSAGPGSLHGLPVDGTRLQDEVRNTHQLFSEVEEQTQRNIRALDRLQSECKHLEQWLQGVEGRAATDKDLSLLQEEALEQSVRTQALNQLVSSLQSSTFRQSALLEESSELLKRHHHHFQTRGLRGPGGKQSSVSRDVRACQTLSKSTQSPAGVHRQTPDSPLGENPAPHARAAVSGMAEAHLGELRVTGNPLSDGAGPKQDIQGRIQGGVQKSEAAWRDLLQPGRSCHSVLQVDPDLTCTSSSLMDELKGVCSGLEQRVCNEEHCGQPLQDCRHKLTSLLEKMSACRAQKEASAEPITDAPALQALLQEVTGVEKELLQIKALKDSITASSSAEDQVRPLQNHKRALDSSIREGRSLLTDEDKQRVQREKGEAPRLQTDRKELSENLCGNSEVSPDLTQLKQQWQTIQDCDTRPRVCDLQQAEESGSRPEVPPADVTLTVAAVAEDLDRLASIHLKKKQPCAENPADVGRHDINQLQRWRQTVQADLSSPSQVSPIDQPTLSATKIEIQHLLAEQETFETVPDAQERDKYCEDTCVRPHKVFTIVLDLERPQLQDIVGDCSPDVLRCLPGAKICDAQLTKSSSVPEKKSEGFTTSPGPESDETDLEIHYTKSGAINESSVENLLPKYSSAFAASEFEGINSTDATSLCRGKSESQALVHSEVLNSSKSFGTVAERQLAGARAAETTSLDVRWEEKMHYGPAEEQTMSSVLCAGNATQTPAGDNKQPTVSAGAGQLVRAEGCSPESLQPQRSTGPKRRVKATLPFGGSEREVPASLEDGQRQTRDSMQPERTAPGPAPGPPAGEATGGPPGCRRRRSAVRDVLPEIQSLVESGNIIKRTPQIDFNWHLKSFPGESQIRLVRAVQNVLACRYQPAQLDVSAMAKQLQEAEDCRRCVQEQVATLKSMSGAGICDPDVLKRAEGQWSAALLDASATVQVKAAQLDQVKEYHKRMKITRAFLKVVAAEKDNMSLTTLRSSALQADKLQGLLQAVVQKADSMEELLQLCRRFSVHLSDAESSGALLAQLGDVQEEWRLLEGSIKRALQHASSSTSQYSLLIREAEQLKAKLDALRPSSLQSRHSKSALELVCLSTDVKLYNQLYMHLQSQTDALVHFALGQKEKDELSRSLKDLGSLLNVTESKLHTSNDICGAISSTKINKQLQDLIVWAKQAENHISVGRKSALFPEEACVQIVEMKKFQTDIWFRSSKMKTEVENMKAEVSDMENEESDQVLKTIEDLYEAIADSLNQVLDTMRKNLQERETLLCQFASMDAWLAEMHAQRDPCAHVDNVSKADIGELESELKSHKRAAVEIEAQLKRLDAVADACREIAVRSSPGESRYLVNRLSGLWAELQGLLAHEKALSWELEELIHELTTSDEELSAIRASLKHISTELVRQRFPLTQEALTTVAHLKHALMERQCQVRGLKQFPEARRSSMLCTIGDLQDQCKALSVNAVEQDKYLHLRRQMVESRDVVEEQIRRAKDQSISVAERVMLCQSLLVELPLVKTQCQEVADQLETIAEGLEPSDLNPEKERIRRTVEALVSWEHSVTDDIKNLEAKLLPDLHFSSEHLALTELFQRTRVELEGVEPVTPDEKAIDIALTRNLIIWRHMESGMRVLEGLGRKEKVDLKNYKDLYSLRDATMRDCHSRTERLCQARESLKDYHWAAQGAICFLHNAEATFLSAPGGFLDCTEEQTQTQQALEALEDGFQAHICHLVDLVPDQACLSRPMTEQLHTSLLSQLLVGRAVLEAQAQLRMESLQRCEVRQQSHRKCHEDIRQRLSGFEIKLSECATERVTSSDEAAAQQKRATVLLEGLRGLAGQLDELRAGCPVQSCGVGKDGELGALWRRWVSLRRGVGVLVAHTEQRGEEWKDITTSMEQCCSFLVRLQSEVPDSSAVSFSQEEPLELLAQADMHRALLEQEQQALSSLEHRLEHALGLSGTQEPTSPGPVAETLVRLQDQVKSLKERNLLVVAAAQAEDKERQQVQVEIAEWEQNMLTLLPSLEACSNPCKQQELRQDLSSQKDKLKCIMDGVQGRYAEVPAGISTRLQEAQLSLQRGEEKLMEKSNSLRRLDSQVAELGSGLERVKVLLEQRSPTVNEAQNAIKHVWDELDAWHSRLMLLESEVQDVAEEHPHQAHLLMDQLNRPLQLYQNAAQMAEQRTAFLSKVPACLQEFEDLMYGAACWLDEAQSWLSAPCSFPTARGLQNHANSLQLVLDDSERIRHTLQAFRPVLGEISTVCDVSTHEDRVNQNDQQVQKMQRKILQPLEQILPAVGVVEAIEAELKTMEKNVTKITAILSSVDDTHITLMEHLQNRQVILANVQSMQRTLEEMARCKGELHLPQGAEDSLLVFSRARLLLQPLEELQQLTHQQAALLQNKIREEKDTTKDLGIIAVSGGPEDHLDRVPQKCTVQDPEETLSASDVQKEEIARIKQPPEVTALESLAGVFTSEVKTSCRSAEVPRLLSGNPRTTEPESDKPQSGLIETGSIVGEAFSDDTVTIEPLLAAASLAVEDKSAAAAAKLDSHGSPKCEGLAKCPQAAAAVGNTRLIPARPETPFTSTRGSDGFMEEADNLHLSTRPHQHLNNPNVLKEQREESPRAREMSEEPMSMAEQEQDNEGELRWSHLNTQIFQKLITLKKVKDGHHVGSEDRGTPEKDPEGEPTSPGSASAVLLQTHECLTMMRQIVSSPGVNDTLYEAARKLLLCLDALTDLLLTPGEDDPQLRLLQRECVSTELVTLCEMLSKVESRITPALSREKPEALRCLASLQECLQITSSHNQLIEHRLQEHPPSQLCNLDEFEVEQSEMFPNIKDVSILEQCVQGRHQRESPEVKANLQQVSRSLLQGITRLLELGEECITEAEMSTAHNCSQLQAIRCRRKKLLGVLTSQLAFVQHLFQREPGALKCQEAERVQLEVRAKALQQQAVQQEVAYERRMEEWTRWEDNSGRLAGLLDDVEVFISSGEPEGDNGGSAQHRQAACEQTLVRLDDSRAALGLLLDQRKVLQTDPEFAAKVGQAGGALELRWLSTCRRTEQESRRCRDIQDSQDRFQTDFASVSEWLAEAEKHQKLWTNLANTSDLNQECVCTTLITLLDFSMEIEAMSVQRASASREATKLLRLREADCPELRAQLAQLEGSWTQLTSDLSTVQDSLQQQLLAAWPPVKLLSHLEDWRKKLEDRLSLEKEMLVKAEDAGQIAENLRHHRELKAGSLNALLLLDFLCQPGPQPVGLDVRALRSKRTVCAEQLGAVRLQWLHLQGELECQTREAEQALYTCADRERRLQRLHSWIERQKKQLNQWKQPSSQTAAREALLELEAAVSKVKEGCEALQELKSMRVQVETEEDRPCDVSFSGWAESVCRAYVDLSQEMEALQPALQLNVDEWSCYESELKEVSIHTARVRCALQHQPLYSLKQAEGHQDLLEQLQDRVRKGETLWASVDKSYQGLVKKVHPGTAQALEVQMREEQKRWKDAVQVSKNEHTRHGETICLWREYTGLSDRCSLDLLALRRQWEELWRSSPRETQDMVHSVEKLQNAAEDLQSSVADVLGAFKPLIERLEPLATDVIQSETRQLSREVLLLIEAMSAKKKSLQEDMEQQELFRSLLEALEKQAQSTRPLTRFHNTDSIKRALSELSDLFPSLVDVREMSCYVILTNHETERLHMLSRQWVESMTHASDINRELQAERQCCQSFQEKCKSLDAIQKKIEEESMFTKFQSISSLREMMTAHKRLEAEIIIGNQLVHGLLCQALDSMETERGEKSSELMAQVSRVRERWFHSLALAGQLRSSTKEQLGYWRVYQRGSRRLCRLLREGDPLLSSAGPAVFAVHQLPRCSEHDQCVRDALGLHSSLYARTLRAGRQLCETMAESECQSQLQSELQALQDAWERTTSLLDRRRDRAGAAVQKWTECQDTMTSITSELEELKIRLKQPLPEELQDCKGRKHIQETDLLLQHFTGGFRELATMKTDMSQYVAAGDSALLEQQLEQLHSQWEELCTKVSSRRREIADRLNAWTIFNDKNKEFCDWLTQMENKVCHSGELSIEEMVEKLKKDCMEEINLFSENKSHLKQLGEQLLSASDEAKRTQVHGSLQEVNQRWHNHFHQIEARVKKLKETLVAVQQLDKNMSNLRSWLSRIEAELSRPITYSVCHLQEIQRRLVEQQELQRDMEQHTEGVVSVLSLCDVLLRDGDAAGRMEAESRSLQETSNSLDQRWRAVCAIALDRRLRIEETWRLWSKFLDDYSRFEDWLKTAERTAANPNSADVLYTVAKEELKKFEAFQRQVHERLTQLELVNNQYRRLARENRTDRASQLKAMVHEGNRRWDNLHRRVSAILRRLKHFTGQREEFEGTRESMLVWLTELDLQLTNVEHFSESDVHHKIQQLNSFQKEITVNTERIDGLIVFGEGLIQKSSLQDAALIEDELEELHSYCQEVFSRLVRFHQRLSQPPMIREEPALSGTAVSPESGLELICRPWLMRSQGSLPATPTRLLASPLERSGRETPVSVDSLPLEWDHTGDVGGSSSQEDEEEEEEEEEEQEDDRSYFSAPSVLGTHMAAHEPPRRRSQGDTEAHLDSDRPLTSTPLKQGYLLLMSDCSGSIEDIKRVSLILDDEEQPEDLGLTGLCAADKQSGVIERWELLQAQSRSPQEARHLPSDLNDVTSWLEKVTPELRRLQQSEAAASIEDMASSATKLKEMQRTFARYKAVVLYVNLRAPEAAEPEERLAGVNRNWGRACAGLQQWESRLRETLMRCKEFHESLHSLLLWLAHAESRRYAVDLSDPATPAPALQQHLSTLTELREELRGRQTQQASLQALWCQLQPEETDEAREKLHVTSSKLRWLLREVEQDLGTLQLRLGGDAASDVQGQNTSAHPKKGSSPQRGKRDSPPPRSFFYRVLRAAFPLHLLFVFLLLLPCLVPMSESHAGCTGANNFARSFYPMLRYTNGPPPT